MKIDVFRGEKFRDFDKRPLNTDSTISDDGWSCLECLVLFFHVKLFAIEDMVTATAR